MGPLGAVIKGKCPRCREGDIFKTSAFKLSSFHQMHENCSNCNLKFEREPGFFVGAMYVNYAFSVAIIIAAGVALSVLKIYSLYNFILAVVFLVLILLPFLFRYSRILFLFWFGGIDYDNTYKSIKP